MIRGLKYLWAMPATLLGAMFVPLAWCSGGKVQVIEGALEVYGGVPALWLRLCRASAMTIGHVILGRDKAALQLTRAHEHVHIKQYEAWGAFFIPAYFLSSLVAWLRSKHPYYDNHFEQEAFEKTADPCKRVQN
jgi:hypothetical protein